MNKAHALRSFGLVTVLCLVVLGVDSYVHRALPIPKPASADSLAGVVARVGLPILCDSSVVAGVTWWQSPDATLGWVKTDEYAYQGASPWRDLTPLGARADLGRQRIIFARGEAVPAQVKHELTHLECRQSDHADTALFQRIETYRGR